MRLQLYSTHSTRNSTVPLAARSSCPRPATKTDDGSESFSQRWYVQRRAVCLVDEDIAPTVADRESASSRPQVVNQAVGDAPVDIEKSGFEGGATAEPSLRGKASSFACDLLHTLRSLQSTSS